LKPAIIGIDPGITSAYCVLSLDGEIIQTNSGKELTLSDMIKEIIAVCKPVIIGTDKARLPSFVDEVARKLGAEVVVPDSDLTKEEKRNIIFQFDLKGFYDNDHQADSLAAALYAYKKYLPKLQKVQRFLQEKNNGVNTKIVGKENEFLLLSLQTDMHFTKIYDILTKPASEHKIVGQVVGDNKITKKDFLHLFEKLSYFKEKNTFLDKNIEELKQQLQMLRSQNRSLQKRSASFNQKIDILFKFKEERMKYQTQEIQKQQKNAHALRKKVKSLFQFMGVIPQYQLVKKLPTLGQKEFFEINPVLSIADKDIILVENPDIYSEQILKELMDKGIIILTYKKPGKVIRFRFATALISSEDLIEENEHFALIKAELIEKKINREDVIDTIIREYKENRK